jgi:predicted regulator of Ras-like GTPase activity (Roadblock/LC7/MglB family)
MKGSPSILREKDYRRFTEIVSRLCVDTSARVVFLFDRNGQQITAQGSTWDIDIVSFATLAAGNVAATEGLARLVGEKEFPAQFHEGIQNNIYIATLDEKAILIVVFNNCSSVGLVRLRVKRAINDLNQIYEEMNREAGSPAEDTPEGEPLSDFIELTEDDIENFFL